MAHKPNNALTGELVAKIELADAAWSKRQIEAAPALGSAQMAALAELLTVARRQTGGDR